MAICPVCRHVMTDKTPYVEILDGTVVYPYGIPYYCAMCEKMYYLHPIKDF